MITNIRLFSITSLPLLLTGCTLEPEVYISPDETLICPLSFADYADWAICCALTVLLLVQVAIPPMHRFYAGCFRRMLRWLRVEAQRAEKARLLAAWATGLLFSFGCILAPLCHYLYHDRFYPSIAGPFNFGHALFFAIEVVIPLMFASCIAACVGTAVCWWWKFHGKNS